MVFRVFRGLDETKEDMKEENPQELSGRSSSTSSSSARSVSFSTVEIRQYERVLGDNPSCSSGPSISIGWNYDQDKTVVKKVFDAHDQELMDELEDAFEQQEHEEGPSELGDGDRMPSKEELRKAREKMVIARHEREDILKHLGYSRMEIAAAIRHNVRCKKNRRQTVNNLNLEPVEVALESVLCCKSKGGVAFRT